MQVVLSHPKLVIGEGTTDAVFFQRLIAARGIVGFDSQCPKFGTTNAGGWTLIPRFLKGLETAPTFQVVKKIVVVADNDTNDRFQQLRDKLKHEAGYNTHKKQMTFMGNTGKPEIAILMIPEQAPGCLETLAYEAAEIKWPNLSLPLGAFFNATPAATWSASRQAKMKLQCALASNCEKRPDVAFKDLWTQDAAYHLPLGDPKFDAIANFLASV